MFLKLVENPDFKFVNSSIIKILGLLPVVKQMSEANGNAGSYGIFCNGSVCDVTQFKATSRPLTEILRTTGPNPITEQTIEKLQPEAFGILSVVETGIELIIGIPIFNKSVQLKFKTFDDPSSVETSDAPPITYWSPSSTNSKLMNN